MTFSLELMAKALSSGDPSERSLDNALKLRMPIFVRAVLK